MLALRSWRVKDRTFGPAALCAVLNAPGPERRLAAKSFWGEWVQGDEVSRTPARCALSRFRTLRQRDPIEEHLYLRRDARIAVREVLYGCRRKAAESGER